MASTDMQGPQDTKFFTRSWTPPPGTPTRAQVLFVHGFVEHIQRYEHCFPRFAEKGIAVFAYDQRGFGQTAFYTPKHSQGVTSWPQQLGDVEYFLKHAQGLAKEKGVPLFLYGHSMGGGLSLAYPTRIPPLPLVGEVAGVVASSPLLRQAKAVRAPGIVVRAGSLLGKLSGTLPLKAEVKAEDCTRDPVAAETYAKDPLCKQVGTFRGVADMLLGGESLMSSGYRNWPKGLPLLIVHGTGDKVTCHHSSEEFVEKVKGKEVGAVDAEYKPFEGFYHEMHNEPGDDKWHEQDHIINWILSRLPSQPSASSSPSAPAATSTTDPIAVAAAAAGVSAAPPPEVKVQPATAPATPEKAEERESKL
ncbi:hypothetical protein JCM10213_003935 [Rhodosporidiobolus nylandii]